MKTLFDTHLRRDLIKLGFVVAAIVGTFALFIVTPALSTPTFVSIVITMMLSPLVAAFERQGYSRLISILIVLASIGLLSSATGYWAFQSGASEWASMKEKAPEYYTKVIETLRVREAQLKTAHPFLATLHGVDALVQWIDDTRSWFSKHSAALMGDLLLCVFIAPIITFFLLMDGRSFKKRFFQLVPNRFFESIFIVTNQIFMSITDYVRAKLIEALLVAAMTTVGLLIVGSPYAVVLGIVAGVTNIIPYVGPFIGAVPGILIAIMDQQSGHIVVPVILVYAIANVIDMVIIFPVVVAKLVNLHPLLLIAAVTVGQQYYGLIGMLISIPIATALKVVLTEIYTAVYESKRERKIPLGSLNPAALENLSEESSLLRVD